jgi:hypothetical protein
VSGYHTLDQARVVEDVAGDVVDQAPDTVDQTVDETRISLCNDVVRIVVVLEAQGARVAIEVDVAAG